ISHGYFGRLALTWQLGSLDPAREAVLKESHRAVIVTFTGVIIGVLSLLAGKKIRPLYQPPPRAQTVYVEMFALYLVLMVGFSMLARVASRWWGFSPI